MGDDGVAENTAANPRLEFLKSIGLENDPFATPVAEQELNLEDIPPRFYSYFTSPSFENFPREQDLFQRLRALNHAFIFGVPGSGKTTLRLILEADCRTRLDNTLVVSYNLGADILQPLSPEQHRQSIARALALDLFVQIVEQFDLLHMTNVSDQVLLLRQVFSLSGCRLRSVVNRILENPRPNSPAGLGMYWSLISRPAVRYVPFSKPLLDLLNAARLDKSPCPPPDQSTDPIHTGWEIAKQWGFARMFVLVDGVDARNRTTEWMMALIEPLLHMQKDWGQQGIFLKCFLPQELENPAQDSLANLHLKYIRDRIIWDKEALRALLRERFHSANSRKVDFDAVAGEGLEEKLDNLILDSAEGVPRRLLQIVSSLIDVHIARAPHESKFTHLDWERLRRDWAFEPPPLRVVD